MSKSENEIYMEIEKAMPGMSETEKGIAINLIEEGWTKEYIIDHICYDGWLGEYIDQVSYNDKPEDVEG